MSPQLLAEAMGRPVQLVRELIKQRRGVTPETALDLERALDVPASFWVNMQGRYELTRARNERKARRSA